ncbi:type IV secretion protein Rhs [Schlegelella sp. S2-27]|uniref:Type IV secretion protein Rhs n=1 Tax=Caldimonas mangrovi TaxID=2944811 RepID=A0ABT0YTZ5_9BURK|nr:RHS repeat-associated core domain-containing protein [Caldimonas mangrovi]MCM5681571.1 type IV secretion protein Rhs [Caldimonas mangrovi]
MNHHILARTLALLPLAWACSALAQTLPPPPVSPAPVVNYEYDAEGNPTKQVQAPGVAGFGLTTSHSYDNLHRRKDTTDARQGKIQFGYDGLDRTTQVTDPRSLVTQYPRTGLGEATQLISPDTGTTGYTYDAAGNLKTATDARGVTATYSYDALNRLTQIVYSQSGHNSRSFGWTYDQSGTDFGHGIGRLTTASFPAGTTRYRYDEFGRIVQHTQALLPANGANSVQITHSTAYGYDSTGRLSHLVYPSGRQLSYSYTQGQLTGLSLAPTAGASAQPLLSDIRYSPFGPPVSWNWHLNSGTKAHQRVYDLYGRLVRYPLGGAIRDLTYDAANRITAYTHWNATTGASEASADQQFGYDELGRLTSVVTAQGSWSFSYDANGNRTQAVLNGSPSAYTVSNTSNRLEAVGTGRSFGHDPVGNTTTDSGLGYTATYSLENRLGQLTKAGTSYTYTHNADGQRVRKYNSAGAATTVLFVYDLDGQLLGEYDRNGHAIKEYVWMGNTPVAVFTPGATASDPPTVYYIHVDHLNTPRMVRNQADQRRWRWMLAEPFGSTAAENNPDGLGNFTFNLRFPGQYFDQETGLHYNYFRDYDATVGRYVQSDPIGLAGGINTYVYTFNRPTAWTDALGLAPDLDRDFSNPVIGIPNPSITAQHDLARRAQLAWNAMMGQPRPKNMTPKEEGLFDKYCANSGDPCSEIKNATNRAIDMAYQKMGHMQRDPGNLFGNAYSSPNPSITGTATTWIGHQRDLIHRIETINSMISLGQRMGCDMTPEIIRAMGVHVPNTPAR